MKIKNKIFITITVLIFNMILCRCIFNIYLSIDESIKFSIAFIGGGFTAILSFLFGLFECYVFEHIKNNNQKSFKWDNDKTNNELYNDGFIILTVRGRSKAAQKFVEALSYKINCFCDFRQSMGYIYILCENNDFVINKAIKAINDKEWMSQFIVPYSEESYNNETYFEIC